MTSRHPFTAAQWQELEHQALFFKFMMYGLPIPPDLIFSIKGRSSQQSHHIGWTCFQLGLSQSSSIDPEPSRCRRTDGKKWRCSRHTTGDSKYCERHMHRGKSRPIRKHPHSKQLQTYPTSSSVQESASAGSGTQSNSNSNISSVSSDINHQHQLNLFNTHSSKPVKDSTFKTFLDIEESLAGSEKRERIMQYHQFIEESPETRRDSWLKLVI